MLVHYGEALGRFQEDGNRSGSEDEEENENTVEEQCTQEMWKTIIEGD